MSAADAPPSMGATPSAMDALAGIPVRSVECRDGLPTLEVLRDRAGFETVTFITAVDRWPATPRFEVLWQLLSVARCARLRLRLRVGAEDAVVPSCMDLWPGAAFMERECFDMFGIRFAGHAPLRRLLMPEEYGHHPLRKDFPHQGIEPDRLYRAWDRERRREWRGGR
jgi:NADH-quinone oxidoreductase subunit C